MLSSLQRLKSNIKIEILKFDTLTKVITLVIYATNFIDVIITSILCTKRSNKILKIYEGFTGL